MNAHFTNMRDLARAFAHAMDLISPEVQDHHYKVAYLSYRIAEELNLDEKGKRLAIYAALFHDVGSVALDSRITLADVERSAEKFAATGADILGMFPRTHKVSEIVRLSQTSWKNIKALPKLIKNPYVISQTVHLADAVSLVIDENTPVLVQAENIINSLSASSDGEFSPAVVNAFIRTAKKEYVWMDMLYKPDCFLDFIKNDNTVTLDETVRLTELMSLIIDFRSPFTAMHSAGVAASAVCLAELMGMSEDECSMMRIAGNLHDLGKLKVPKEILEKPGKLTDEEFNIVKEHAYFTYVLLNDIEGFEEITKWAAFHHEKLDGNGYPYHLEKGELPLGSRIMAVADIFSALTEDRPYRKGMNKEEALGILRQNASNGAVSDIIVELLAANYEQIDKAREEASAAAGKRYFASIKNSENN